MSKIAVGKEYDFSLSYLEREGSASDVASEHLNTGKSESDQIIKAPRASSIYSACIRMHCIATKLGVPIRQRLDVGTKITFGIGRAVHEWVQNTDEVFGDNKYGWWKCRSCGDIMPFSNTTPESCGECGAKKAAFKYEEHHVKTKAPYICSGHPDMFIKTNSSNKLRVVEVKTIASSGFKGLVMPLVEHNWQLQYYMWSCSTDKSLLYHTDGIDDMVGYVLYISKGAMWNTLPLKMYPVKKDESIIQHIKNKLLLYNDYINGGELPRAKAKCELKLKTEEPIWQCPVYRQCGELYREENKCD